MCTTRSCTALLAALLMLTLGSAAAAAGKGKQDKPKEAEVVKQGKILVVRGLGGGEPQITDQQGKRWLIDGPAREETLRLSGHTLKLWALVATKKKLMTPVLKVNRYEILDSGGRKPLVGVLRRVKLSYVLERKDKGNLTIKARSRSFYRLLSRRNNCKIWVVGDLEGTTLKAIKFGWITCKLPKPIKPRKESTK
jgi:hypothetical protein